MTALERIREYAQDLVADEAHMIRQVGTAGAVVEVTRAKVARRILEILDQEKS